MVKSKKNSIKKRTTKKQLGGNSKRRSKKTSKSSLTKQRGGHTFTIKYVCPNDPMKKDTTQTISYGGGRSSMPTVPFNCVYCTKELTILNEAGHSMHGYFD